MYAIVEWFNSTTSKVSAVPSNWLINDGTYLWCFWPPSAANGDSAINNQCLSKSNWPKHTVRYIGCAGEFDK
jgi:hypothetical protein